MKKHVMKPTLVHAPTLDCAPLSTREINQQLKALAAEGVESVEVLNPAGRHNLAVGLAQPIKIQVRGPVGSYCGGLAENINLEVFGACGWSLGENLMAGTITVHGNASSNAAASAHGGSVRILGNAGPRAGIALKGATVVVTGNVGYGSAFMMQQGCLIICGDAGPNLADSMYDGSIFVGGQVDSLGADAMFAPLSESDGQRLTQELAAVGRSAQDYDFKKVVCAKELYHFKAKDWAKWKDAY
jgi:methylamine---glutamate N-methyltransferase subunit B